MPLMDGGVVGCLVFAALLLIPALIIEEVAPRVLRLIRRR